MKVVINAPAKINLYLDVIKKRKDGYHEVNMIMQSVSLFDQIIITKTDKKDVQIISSKKIPVSIRKNTVYIAAQKFFEYTKILNPGININIKKCIPIGSGLAGGSSDAAATLIGLNELFNCKISKNDLAAIGEKVGADVPFNFFGGTMLASGIGTKLSSITQITQCYIVIVKPNFSISTKTAYQACDTFLNREKNKTVGGLISALKAKDLLATAKNIYNKFENVVDIKEIKSLKNFFVKNSALNACMTGTGSAVYGIFDTIQKAKLCANKLRTIYDEVFLVMPLSYGCYLLQN